MFTDARISAKKPKIFRGPGGCRAGQRRATATAISAPTTITDEIALVTLISGVCSAGVTLHTT